MTKTIVLPLITLIIADDQVAPQTMGTDAIAIDCSIRVLIPPSAMAATITRATASVMAVRLNGA